MGSRFSDLKSHLKYQLAIRSSIPKGCDHGASALSHFSLIFCNTVIATLVEEKLN